MGCVNSKTEDDGGNKNTKANAPANLAPIVSIPTSTSKLHNTGETGIPLQSKTSNSYLIGSGPGAATSPQGTSFPDSGPVSPSSESKPKKVYVARFAYQARTTEDLSFEKGEKLLVVALQENDWWLARSVKTEREGYIPSNYVAEAESYEAEE